MDRILTFLQNGKFRRTFTRQIKESRFLRVLRMVKPEPRLWFRDKGKLPSFLIVGAQRAGSTYLHDAISVCTDAEPSPLQKEIHYFDNKYYRRVNWYRRFFRKYGQ
jgi:hypothetical protein